MIQAIPKRLLIHSAELITEFEPDIWGKASETAKQKLENIRIEYSAKNVSDSSGTVISLSATLFFDCKNSSPEGIKFALKGGVIDGKTVENQQVKFGEKLFTVKTIEPLYADSDKIHHYEVGLA